MKVVILAGGLGSRLSEETYSKPKPLIEIGNRPIIWHIMKHYYSFGLKDFIICCGYKGYQIKKYFTEYYLNNSDIKINLEDNSIKIISSNSEKWNITLVDTGEKTMTGGRLKRVGNLLPDDNFCLTYGDGLSDIKIDKLIEFHNNHGKLATLSSSNIPNRFGILDIQNDKVLAFKEKPSDYINIGYFVLSKKVLDLINGDQTIWEQDPINNLAKDRELMTFKHDGFFQPMDTLREKIELEKMWNNNRAPWKLWS